MTLGRSATLAKPERPRTARRALLEHVIRTARQPCERRWAARELGKLWAAEALDKLRRRIA